jgi:hypothetical protein
MTEVEAHRRRTVAVRSMDPLWCRTPGNVLLLERDGAGTTSDAVEGIQPDWTKTGGIQHVCLAAPLPRPETPWQASVRALIRRRYGITPVAGTTAAGSRAMI